ncbi:MAG: hypothetical protein IKN03_00950 [Fibrobacter sp.]|nr:hypothetical protein [Fibrobacter sp.]
MNIELENKIEKKVYVAPAMEIMNMESEAKLLSGSSDDGVDLKEMDADDYYNELN